MNTVFCPSCEKITEIKIVKTVEDIEIKGERISVPAEFFKCLSCGEEFDDPNSKHDPLIEAYREYRRRYDLMQPEDIRTLRHRYGLTQKELAKLLGFGEITISRYENGALQDNSHNELLRMIENPSNLLAIIEKNGGFLSENKKQKLLEMLDYSIEQTTHSYLYNFLEYIGKYKSDISSGFQRLNINKLFQAILFFCENGTLKTKLNKLLFYADFTNFYYYTTSITGVRYLHYKFGPVPEKYQFYYATLQEEGTIKIEETPIFDYIGEMIYSLKAPDLTIFSELEKNTLLTIMEYFKEFNAKHITDFTHKEKGYLETQDSEIISYAYADYLQILSKES